MKYSDIISKNNALKEELQSLPYEIQVLSNITVNPLENILEYDLRKNGINADIIFGDYDNIVQESIKTKYSVILIFWEVYNVIDGFNYKYDSLSDDEFKNTIEKIKKEIDVVFNALKEKSFVVINKFSSLLFTSLDIEKNRLDTIVLELNQYISDIKLDNMIVFDIDKVISNVGVFNSIDLRYYHLSKSLYTVDFYINYSKLITPLFLSLNGKIKKALIFDCDNTLWSGIIGEDGIEKVKVFQEVQYLAKRLAKNGVIIGLCSKNNLKDVNEVFDKHKDMILSDDDIVIKKINWDDKVTNIKSIAKELNIGMDSIVFLDDSDFEVNFVKEHLPLVDTYKVPKKEYEYSQMMREITNLFFQLKSTNEDSNKIKMYKENLQRDSVKKDTNDLNSYLQLLELEIFIHIDDEKAIQRVAQMTQKTNQFNLTTKRYTENEIKLLVKSQHSYVLTINVTDKFGDYGVVGLCILKELKNSCQIDSFLLSCRALGRSIENKFMDEIVKFIHTLDIKTIDTTYIKTLKNEQVSQFYDTLGFTLVSSADDTKKYVLKIKDYVKSNINYIKVN